MCIVRWPVAMVCVMLALPVGALQLIANSDLCSDLRRSEVACVGVVTRVEPVDRAVVYYAGQFQPQDHELTTTWRSARLTIAVERVLKGQLPGEAVTVWFGTKKDVAQTGWGSSAPRPVAAVGARQLFFLRHGPTAEDGWQSMLPNAATPTTVDLGAVPPEIADAAETPLRRAMALLLEVGRTGEPTRAAAGLRKLGEVGWLLHRSAATASAEVRFARRELAEPEPDLEDYVARYILPGLAAMRISQPNLSTDLILVAGQLQDPSVFDALVGLARQAPPGMSAALPIIRAYGHPRSLGPLLALLAGDRADLREAAADALRNMSDKRAVPALLDSLTPDTEATWMSCMALSQLLREPGVGAMQAFAAERPRWLSFWRDWAAKHQDEIAKLRREADELLKPAAAPNP